MKDIELSHGLSLLADEAEPATVDVYDIIAKAKAYNRNRRATAATALATATVAGVMIATVSLGAGGQSTQVGSPPSGPPVTAWSPPAGPTMMAVAVNDNQMVTYTEQLAEVWPSVVPQGVTTEKLSWFTGTADLGPLEFRGFNTTVPPNSITYAATAELSDSLGANELLIHVIKASPHDWPFGDNRFYEPESTHNLPDGTRVKISTQGNPAFQRVTEVVRPDGTAIQISENNITGQTSRTGFILDTNDLLKLATALSYS